MSPYDVQLMPSAQKDLNALSGDLLSRLEMAILGLYNQPRPPRTKKLAGSGSKWRIRVGDYIILYEIDEARKQVKIFRIAHRKEVYR